MSEEAREPITLSDTSGVYELRIDLGVTARGAAPRLQIAATVHVPAGYSSMTRATAIFAVPGGGYSRAIDAEAAAVSVPVFVGVGERDVCPDPRAEPRAYANSADITVHIVPRMAHMHNFAGTRELLWARLEHWTRGIAGSSGES